MPQQNYPTITEASQEAYQYIESVGLAKKTLQQYWYCGVIPVRRYFESQTLEKYSPESMRECVVSFRTKYEQGDIYEAKFRCVRKISVIIDSLQKGDDIIWGCLTPWRTTALPEPFNSYRDGYIESKRQEGYRESTLRGVRPVLKHFLLFAVSLGYRDLLPFTESDAMDYISALAGNHQHVGECLSLLRPFGKYLFCHGFTAVRLDRLFQVKVPARRKYHTGFTKEEALRIIAGIDRSTVCGKRDYAILMLAMHTGLRGIDVLHMSFADIDWKKHEIHLTQSKTGRGLILPVPVSVLNAVADYILNARPESTGKNIIFLKCRMPYAPIKSWSAYSIVKRSARRVGIGWTASEHKGFHSFRRSIASWMLEAEIPLDTIKEVLGHTNADSSKPYISVHQAGLAACALGLDGIPLGREELQ